MRLCGTGGPALEAAGTWPFYLIPKDNRRNLFGLFQSMNNGEKASEVRKNFETCVCPVLKRWFLAKSQV